MQTRTFIIAFALLLLSLIGSTYYAKNWWEQNRLAGDGSAYYMYLPAIFIYDDLGSFDQSFAALRKYRPNAPDPKDDIYGYRPTPNGKIAIKYPVGLPILQAPFFLIAHTYAKLGGDYPADGYSLPYQAILAFSTLLYVFFGLLFLYFTLKRYFSEVLSYVTLVLILFGTNLLFFTSFSNGMSHGYLFFPVSALIYFTDSWYFRKRSGRNAAGIGFSLGLIAIIRSQDVILGLVPLLWGLRLRETGQRLQLALHHWKQVLFAFFALVLVLAPQLVYYKFISGKWYYYTYVGEVFNWSKPRIIDGLTHASNGWLRYSPLMVFPLIWLVAGRRQERWRVTVIAILLIQLYIAYSWWCWNYIAGMGSRPMVDIYPLLAFPLASFLAFIAQNRIRLALAAPLLIFSALLSIKFTWQQYNGHIFSEAHNKAFYQSMLFKLKPDRQALTAFFANRVQPKDGSLHFERQLASYDFEHDHNPSPFAYLDDTTKHAVLMTPEMLRLDTLHGQSLGLKKGTWIKVNYRAYAPEQGRIWDAFSTGLLILNQVENGGAKNSWLAFRGTNLIGNSENSIWNTGDTNQWGEISFFTQLKFDCDGADDYIEIMSFNPSHQPWYLDDLRIEHWK